LIPDEAFDRAFTGDVSQAGAAGIADRLKVSREPVFRKFLDRSLIDDAAYDSAAKQWTAQIVKRRPRGNHYYSKIAYLGEDYINLAFSRYYQNRIPADQLAEYLDTKPKNLAALEQCVSG